MSAWTLIASRAYRRRTASIRAARIQLADEENATPRSVSRACAGPPQAPMRSGAVHSIAVVVLLCAVGSRARPTVAPPPANVTAMQALLGRVLSPSVVSAFTLEAIPADPGTGHDVFELEQGNGTVILRGNTCVLAKREGGSRWSGG